MCVNCLPSHEAGSHWDKVGARESGGRYGGSSVTNQEVTVDPFLEYLFGSLSSKTLGRLSVTEVGDALDEASMISWIFIILPTAERRLTVLK